MDGPARIPIVAIVGRPNVGKSTLFNRYAGHRRALVADSPGLTRDRIIEAIEVEGRRILLVDTAGLEPDSGSGLASAVQAQAESAIHDADAILFVVDGKAGLLPEDEAIAQTLRRTRKPIALAVNKIDRPTHHADRMLDFFRLGFERIHAVSGEHGSGAFDALEDLVAALPPADTPVEEEADDTLRIAIVGRPNVGKSSLMNRLLGQERVVVSDEGGTTRDAIDIRFEEAGRAFVLVDTAGLRRPGRRKGTGERVGAMMTVRALERAQVAILVVDAGEGFTDQDAHVARLARDVGCAAVVAANKWDLVAPPARREIRETIAHGLRFMADVPVIPLSARTGAGVRKLLPAVVRVADAAGRRIPTAELNRWLQDIAARHPPGMAKRGRGKAPIKLQYASQTGVNPPAFVIFCTDAQSVLPAYRRFLENRLRQTYGFEGTPIRLWLRSRKTSPRP
jgi:GTP-binding protein